MKRKAAAPAVDPPSPEEESEEEVEVEEEVEEEEEEAEPEEEEEPEEEVEPEEEAEEEEEAEVEEEEAEGEAEEEEAEGEAEEEEAEAEAEAEEEEEEEAEESEEEESSEEEDEDSKREALTALLLPYTKDQLVTIIKEAANKNPDLISGLIKSAESDPIHRNLFIHGLTSDVTKEILTAAFKSYGQIEESHVVVDRSTGRCKGFGFVLFKTRAAARKALKEPEKRIGPKIALCQLAAAGRPGSGNAASESGPDLSRRKLYVGNVSPDINPEKLRAFFAKFGEIEDGPMGLSKGSGKFHGFAIFIYKTEEGLRRALQDPIKDFNGRTLDCSVYTKSGSSAPPAAEASASSAVSGLENHPLMGHNFNHGPLLLGQNPNLSLLNHHPLMVLQGHSLNTLPATTSSYVTAVPTSRNQPGLIGLSGAGIGMNTMSPGMNTMSPGSVINAYSSQALQGLGPYQSSQLGHRSAPTSCGQPGSSVNYYPSHFRR